MEIWVFFKRRESQWGGAESAKENGKVERAFYFPSRPPRLISCINVKLWISCFRFQCCGKDMYPNLDLWKYGYFLNAENRNGKAQRALRRMGR